MVVLREISGVATPPMVSMPRVSGRDVEEEHVLDLALENAGLNGGAHGYDFIRD